MSISDPILKSLKKAIINLCIVQSQNEQVISKEEITDSNPHLQTLCEILEEIMRKGLYRVGGFLNMERRDYWNWLNELPTLLKCPQNNSTRSNMWQLYNRYVDCLDVVKSQEMRVDTVQGKGRLMIRALLQHKLIHWPLECLCFSLSDVNRFYSEFNSLFGNEILSQMLISQLSQLSVVSFKLTLDNCTFLNDSWLMPVYRSHEFVPCRQLGVHLISVDAYQIVETIAKGSVAEEDNFLEPGDVLDVLFDCNLKWCRMPLRDLMKSNEKKPVHLSVIKLRMVDGSTFPPIMKLLNRPELMHITEAINLSTTMSNSNLPLYAHLNELFPNDIPATNLNLMPQYGLRYVGSTYIGPCGGVSKIEGAIAETLKHYYDPSLFIPVYIELGEKDLLVRKAVLNKEGVTDRVDTCTNMTGEAIIDASPVLFAHAYPQISSCGRRIDCARFLAYIVGESTCTISKHFVCHVFEARTDFASKSILCSIGQGFERTHWTI